MCVCVCVPHQGHGWRWRSRSYISDRLQQLTLEQKLYVAQREITETRQDQEKLRQSYERIQDSYKVKAHRYIKKQSKIKQPKKRTLTIHFPWFCLSFQASLKEADLRLSEIRKAKNEFERRLLKSMKDSRLEMKEPEKVLQYIEDKLKVPIRFSPMMMSTCVKYLKHWATHLNSACERCYYICMCSKQNIFIRLNQSFLHLLT